MRKKVAGDAVAAEIPPGMSTALLADLHLLTRDGQLNADARRKLKQIRHLLNLLRPALDDAYARHAEPRVVDCGAGKSYLGFLLYDTVIGPAGRGELLAIEARPELATGTAARAARFGHTRFQVAADLIAGQASARAHVVTALHACDTATDEAIALAVRAGADHVALVPCCQAEVARQLDQRRPGPDAGGPHLELFRHPWHRREFGSHLTNVVRALALEACGYHVTVTEFAGWDHTAKNELILGKRVARQHVLAARRLAALLAQYAIEPAVVRLLRASGVDPLASIGGVPAQSDDPQASE
jgi:hypothetical protein